MSTKFIRKIENYEKNLSVPADKSILHRAILLGSIAEGVTQLYTKIGGADNQATLLAMQKLGANISVDGDRILIKGCQKFNDNLTIDCQNSGTTMRLLAGLLSSKNVHATLIGDDSLNKRPMKRVTDLLQQMGASVDTSLHNTAPIFIRPSSNTDGKVFGGNIHIEIASAQLKSAVLLAGLNAVEETKIIQKVQTRDHTERMLKTFGADIAIVENGVSVQPSKLKSKSLQIPSDCSSAAFFLALGALRGRVTCKKISINPTRSYYLNVMQRMGISLQIENRQFYGNEEIADVTAFRSNVKNIQIMSDEVPKLIDELPILAILMAFAEGKSEVFGAGELKVKESNRLQAIVQSICTMGGKAQVVGEGFEVNGFGFLEGGNVESFNDHRIAMSAAIALACSKKGGYIQNADCVSISFQNFYELLEG